MSDEAVRVYYDADTDRTRLDGRTFAIVGYGSQGHAHALNLRDSGARVIVGLRAGSPSAERAKAAGLDVRPVAVAAAAADTIMMLVPDQDGRAIYERDVAPGLAPGKTLMFAHGFNIHYGEIAAPDGVDVTMVAPKSPGHLVRSEYEAGRGVPALVAVHQDASGHALANALAYASGIGCTRAGVLETSFREETETDLFGEQAVLCGGVTALVKAGLRDADRGGLPAGDGLLRVHARAQADRGPDVPRRDAVHAPLHQRHGRVRGLHPRPARHHRGHPRRDAPDSGGSPERLLRQGVAGREPRGPRQFRSACGRRTATTRSSASAPRCGR